jgi:hypothetical protein
MHSTGAAAEVEVLGYTAVTITVSEIIVTVERRGRILRFSPLSAMSGGGFW